jgi:hypothetical protein
MEMIWMADFKFVNVIKSQRIREVHIMFSGEACFHLNGYVNRHKTVSWAQDNPHVAVDAPDQTNARITVRCAIHGNTLLGPIPGRRIEPWKIFAVAECCVGPESGWTATLNTTSALLSARWRTTSFRSRSAKLVGWIGLMGPIGWPPRSPDLTPWYFPLGSSELPRVPCAYIPLAILKKCLFCYYMHNTSDFRTSAMQCAASYQPMQATRGTSITFPSLVLFHYETGIMRYLVFLCVVFI